MSLADTHCHLDADRFDSDRLSVIERAMNAGVRRILIPSIDVDSAARVLELAASHTILFAGVGVHPTQIGSLHGDWLQELRALASAKKVVAVGEVGLDYYWIKDPEQRRLQTAALSSQLQVAGEAELPVSLHLREQDDCEGRDCTADMLALLTEWAQSLREHDSDLVDRAGVLHSFAGSLETARRVIELGFYIGISGPITYPSAGARREILQHLPLDRILIETDGPYLPPQQFRGKRNEPAFIVDIADKIAEIMHCTRAEVARVTCGNAARLFGWGEAP